jgi:uncharacterized protein (AIM24 family)
VLTCSLSHLPAMLTMSNNLEMDAKMDGGVGSALARKVFSGESMFLTHFRCASHCALACSHSHVCLLYSRFNR